MTFNAIPLMVDSIEDTLDFEQRPANIFDDYDPWDEKTIKIFEWYTQDQNQIAQSITEQKGQKIMKSILINNNNVADSIEPTANKPILPDYFLVAAQNLRKHGAAILDGTYFGDDYGIIAQAEDERTAMQRLRNARNPYRQDDFI